MTVYVRVGGGGLGVQMFQVSAAAALALELDRPLSVRIELTDRVTSHSWNPRIGELPLEAALRSAGIEADVADYVPGEWDESSVQKWSRPEFDQQFFSRNYGPIVALEGERGSHHFHGRWQREVRAIVRHMLPTPPPLAKDVGTLHIRLGDYLSSPTHHKLSAKYFSRCAEIAATDFGIRTLRVYSDEPERAARILRWSDSRRGKAPLPMLEFQPTAPQAPEIDLVRLSAGHVVIMSNSTFSWWAAYLSESAGERILAPSRFFAATSRYLNRPSFVNNHIWRAGANTLGWRVVRA